MTNIILPRDARQGIPDVFGFNLMHIITAFPSMNIVLPYWLIMSASNIGALVVLYMSRKSPRVSRIALFVIFAWAGFANWMITVNPHALPTFANITFSVFDRGPLHSWFLAHSSSILRAIAASQWLVAIALLAPGLISRIGALLGAVMLIVVAPVGFGSAFPFSVFMAIAMYVLSHPRNAGPKEAEPKLNIEDFNISDYD